MTVKVCLVEKKAQKKMKNWKQNNPKTLNQTE